jgi:CDP-4-dehydro-6-deoxyglucose reductase
MPTVRLNANQRLTSDAHRLDLDLTLASHTRPGQFITATVGEHKPGYFALANSPGEALCLLIKADGETSRALVALDAGSEVEISEAIGKGFALEQVAGRELVILCNGSGISACRPVIEAEIAAGLPRPVHFFHGLRSPSDRCFSQDARSWEEAGVRVHTVISGDDPDWTGERGYVQHAAREHGLLRGDVGVLMVGVKDMVEEAKSMWSAAGVGEDALLTNF